MMMTMTMMMSRRIGKIVDDGDNDDKREADETMMTMMMYSLDLL